MISDTFSMNGFVWKIRFVKPNNPSLVDRTHHRTVATTDPINYVVNLSEELHGDYLMTVFLHELGHCALYSFGLIEEIHRMTRPEYWIDMEEFVCNFLADFGFRIFKIAFSKLGYDAWKVIPREFEKTYLKEVS